MHTLLLNTSTAEDMYDYMSCNKTDKVINFEHKYMQQGYMDNLCINKIVISDMIDLTAASRLLELVRFISDNCKETNIKYLDIIEWNTKTNSLKSIIPFYRIYHEIFKFVEECDPELFQHHYKWCHKLRAKGTIL